MTAAAVLALGGSLALAQRSPRRSLKVPAPKASPRPVQPAQKQQTPPAKQPQQPAQRARRPTAGRDAAGRQPPIVYSPWTKFCGKDQNPQAKEVCLTVKEARLETGQFLAGAALDRATAKTRAVPHHAAARTCSCRRAAHDPRQGGAADRATSCACRTLHATSTSPRISSAS